MSMAWFLAQIKPNARKIAERNLARQRFETFLPLIDQTIRQNGRFVQSRKPLFPGYIFVRFDTGKGSWRSINSTQGITKLVSFGQAPAPVPDGLITQLMARCDHDGMMAPIPDLNVGDSVTVTQGPFSDFVAEILDVDEDQRVWLLIDLMGRQTRVAVRQQDIRG